MAPQAKEKNGGTSSRVWRAYIYLPKGQVYGYGWIKQYNYLSKYVTTFVVGQLEALLLFAVRSHITFEEFFGFETLLSSHIFTIRPRIHVNFYII